MKYYSVHFNRPDFVHIQNTLLKENGDELIVINNGPNPTIKKVCDDLNIQCFDVQNSNIDSTGKFDPNGAVSHGNALNFAARNVINFDEDWGLIDHDMFLTKHIDFNDYDCDIISFISDNRPEYLYFWPGYLLCKGGINMSDIDFRPGEDIPGGLGDTGCATYKLYPNYKVIPVKQKGVGVHDANWLQDSNILFHYYVNDEMVGIHYLNGSNWTGRNPSSKNSLLIEELKKMGYKL